MRPLMDGTQKAFQRNAAFGIVCPLKQGSPLPMPNQERPFPIMSPAAKPSGNPHSPFRLKPIDLFFGLNIVLFLVLCVFRYYALFVSYRGIENIHEFFVYALFLLAVVGLLWRHFRDLAFPAYLLPLVELGILIHFFGAFVQIGGERLYETIFLGVPYDKFVHFTNALIACLFVRHLFVTFNFPRTRLSLLFIMLIAMGLGALIEIVEYVVVITIPHNGVGDYDNNMQDLCANMAGCLVFGFIRNFADRH